MTFNNSKITALFLALLLITGCGLYVKDSYEESSLSGTNLGCMNRMKEQFQDYIHQNLPENEVGSLPVCLQSAFRIFKYHVWGQERETYTAEELKVFFEKFFLQDRKISPELLKNLMVLKVALVGGSGSQITAREIDQINIRIAAIGDMMTDIYPYNDIFFSSEAASLERMKQGLSVLRKNFSKLSKETFKNPYSLNSAQNFTIQLAELLNSSSDQNFLWLKAVQALSPFILHSSYPKDTIFPEEWTDLLNSITDALAVSLYFKAGYESSNFQKQTNYYINSVDHFLNFVRNRMGEYLEKDIQKRDILQLVHALKQEGILTTDLRTSSIEKSLQVVVSKIILKQPEEIFEFSFGRKEFLWIESWINQWKHLHQTISKSKKWFQKNPDSSLEDFFQKSSLSNQALKIKELFAFKPLYSESPESGINVHFAYPSFFQKSFNYKHLVMSSIYWSLMEAIMRGYAYTYPDQGMTEQELLVLFEDFKDITEDITGEKSTQASPGKLEFVASNLVLYSTEGYYADTFAFDEQGKKVELISQTEGTELFSIGQFVFQAVSQAEQILEELCLNNGNPPKPKITLLCFKNNILSLIQRWPYMPQLSNFLKTLPEDLKLEYSDILFQLSTVTAEEFLHLETSYLKNLIFALVYQEVMFTRYDLDEDGVLQKQELMDEGAFPLYEGLIQHLRGGCMDKNTKFIYQYAVRKLDLPEVRKSFFKNLHLGIHKMIHLMDGEVSLNRIELMTLAFNLIQKMFSQDTNFKDSCKEEI